jgi:hypothetical protein
MSRKIEAQHPGPSAVVTPVKPFDVPGTATLESSRPIGGVRARRGSHDGQSGDRETQAEPSHDGDHLRPAVAVPSPTA